jgi:hypothetical protein
VPYVLSFAEIAVEKMLNEKTYESPAELRTAVNA